MPPRRKPKKSKSSSSKESKKKAKATAVNLHQGLVLTLGWLWKKGKPIKRLAEEPAVHPLPRMVRMDIKPGVEFKDTTKAFAGEKEAQDELFCCQASPEITIGELRVQFRDWMGRVQGFGLPPPPPGAGEGKDGEGGNEGKGDAADASTKDDESKKKGKDDKKKKKGDKGKKEKKKKEPKAPQPMLFTSGRMTFADDVTLGAIVSFVGVGYSEGVQRGRRVHPAGEFSSQLDLSTQLMRYGSVAVSVGEAVLKMDPVADKVVQATPTAVSPSDSIASKGVAKEVASAVALKATGLAHAGGHYHWRR